MPWAIPGSWSLTPHCDLISCHDLWLSLSGGNVWVLVGITAVPESRFNVIGRIERLNISGKYESWRNTVWNRGSLSGENLDQWKKNDIKELEDKVFHFSSLLTDCFKTQQFHNLCRDILKNWDSVAGFHYVQVCIYASFLFIPHFPFPLILVFLLLWAFLFFFSVELYPQ